MPFETIEAPLPGKILNIKVNSGDKINEDSEICTIEAMKMETPIFTPVAGMVKEISVTEGQIVKAGNTLAIIEY